MEPEQRKMTKSYKYQKSHAELLVQHSVFTDGIRCWNDQWTVGCQMLESLRIVVRYIITLPGREVCVYSFT